MGAFNKTTFNDTNVNAAKTKLQQAGFSKEYIDNFKFIFWDIPNGYYENQDKSTKFETYGNVPNVYYFSGFDGSIMAFLTGVEGKTSTPSNAEELFLAAMDQEILKKIVV